MADFQKYATALAQLMSTTRVSWPTCTPHAGRQDQAPVDAVKTILDPNGIINPGQWAGSICAKEENDYGEIAHERA